jgi:hypothetical protein
MASSKNKNRKELILITKKHYSDIRDEILSMNVGSIYIKTSLEDLSKTRSDLILDNFTTRLFVARIVDENCFFIYGKKKANKGTFNEHCKNTVYEYDDFNSFYSHVINVSSNQDETVVSDSNPVINIANTLNRKGENYE